MLILNTFFSQVSLSHLDLSHNEISSFDSGSSDLAQAGADLKTLDLSDNAIAILGDHALNGLGALLELDLSSNQLSALPPTLFNSSSSMRKLSLRNNRSVDPRVDLIKK